MSYKSRGNYSLGLNLTDDRFKEIFGNSEREKGSELVNAKSLKSRDSFNDNPNAKEIIKIGTEINRFKRLDGVNRPEMEKRFKKDCDKLFTPKPDTGLTNRMADFYCKEYNRVKRLRR
jgi:hypothetical protein